MCLKLSECNKELNLPDLSKRMDYIMGFFGMEDSVANKVIDFKTDLTLLLNMNGLDTDNRNTKLMGGHGSVVELRSTYFYSEAHKQARCGAACL